MRTTILTFTIVALASLSNQCSRHSKEMNSEPNQSASPSIEKSVSDDVKRKKILQGQVEAIQGAIKRESLKLKIDNLRDDVSDAETEIRIWVGFGVLYPRCFIMREQHGRQEAFYIAPKISGSKAAREVKMTKVS